MLSRKNSGEEPPAPIAQLMAESNVVLCPTTKSLSHTQARRNASGRGARIASLPRVTKEMVIRCLTADYGSIAVLTIRVAEKLSRGSTLTVATVGRSIGLQGGGGLRLGAPGVAFRSREGKAVCLRYLVR